jgi:hypothetical protein
MAPRTDKPTTKKVDPVEKLIQEREQDYQGALQIARNDLLAKEAELNQIKEAYLAGDERVEGFEEYLDNQISQVRRARRDVVSEGSYLFENDLRNQGDVIKNVNVTEAGQRKVSQPIPGTEAHHPASVSSTESYVQNMSEYEVRRLWDIMKEQGYTVGSLAEGFIPLSKPAHTTGGKNWGPNYAHVGKEGDPDPGRFKGVALPKGTTAEQAFMAMKPMLDEQRALNEAAYGHPTEQAMRAAVEREMGKPITWSASGAGNLAEQNAAAKAMGINATVISKAFDKYPQLIESGLVPNVSVMTDVGARTPLGTKPTEEVRRQAFQQVRQVTTSQSLGQKAAAIATREPVPVPRVVVPVPTPKPAVKPAVRAAAKPVVKPAAKPKPAAKSVTKSRAIPSRRMPTSSDIRRTSQLSPLNRGSAAYGAIERQANEYVQDLPGYSPFMPRLAD